MCAAYEETKMAVSDVFSLKAGVLSCQQSFSAPYIASGALVSANQGLQLQDIPTLPLLPQEYFLGAPNTGAKEGRLLLQTQNNGAGVVTILDSQIPPRGIVGPPAINGNQAICGLVAPAQSGTVTIASGSRSVTVANSAITLNSIVMVTAMMATPDDTATSFSCVMSDDGSGFQIVANANATAGTNLAYFIVRYS